MLQHVKARPKRRWLQFGMRSLLIAMLLVGCGMGWLQHHVQLAKREKEAVSQLLLLGAVPVYSCPIDETGRLAKEELAAPPWLRKWLGDEFFYHAHELTIHGGSPWRVAHRLPTVKPLSRTDEAGRIILIDDRLAPLADLRHLRVLELRATELTDNGLVHIRNLTQLEQVNLASTHVTDDGLSHLARLDRLTELNLSSTNVHGSGLRHVSWDLEVLELTGSQVRPPGLRSLAKLNQLRVLGLANTRTDDDSLRHIAQLQALEALNLSESRITDAGIESLIKLQHLKSLDVSETAITKAGGDQLRAKLPRAEIKD